MTFYRCADCNSDYTIYPFWTIKCPTCKSTERICRTPTLEQKVDRNDWALVLSEEQPESKVVILDNLHIYYNEKGEVVSIVSTGPLYQSPDNSIKTIQVKLK